MNKIIAITLITFSSQLCAQQLYVWQQPDVKSAWDMGFKGQSVTIHVHDDFIQSKLMANLEITSTTSRSFNLSRQEMTHGDAVKTIARLTAPDATTTANQWVDGSITLTPDRLNIVNASYGWVGGTDPYNVAIARNLQITHMAMDNSAVVVKSAGNSNVQLSNNGGGDGINIALKDGISVIFAGALGTHGSINKKAVKATYSNYPGNDSAYQSRFLMVGVDSSKMTIAGTSFAAPQISAYAAIVGSKFTGADANQVTTQLLNTARTDTIKSYSRTLHGRGEASLLRALAPVAIQ